MRLFTAILAFVSLGLLAPASASAQWTNSDLQPDYLRENSVVVYPTTAPAPNPWDDVRPMLGDLTAFLMADLSLSCRLVHPRSDIAQVMLFGGIYAPLLDFTIRLNFLKGYQPLHRLAGQPEWTYLLTGNLFVAYGLTKAILHTKAVFWGKKPKKGPSWAIIPFAGSGIFGISIGGTF